MSTSKGNTLYPVFLKLDELQTLIVGGGEVGLEKLSFILKNSPDAKIRLVAEEVKTAILSLAESFPQVEVLKKSFEEVDLNGVDVLILATADLALDKEIKTLAKQKGILVNVADTPALCDFYLGSIVTKGDLKIAISTNGKSPTLAKRMREYLEASLPEDTQELIDNLGEIRNQLEGDFQQKVQELNEITKSLKAKMKVKK